jgi:hypothetical protein
MLAPLVIEVQVRPCIYVMPMHTHSKMRRCALASYTFWFWTKNILFSIKSNFFFFEKAEGSFINKKWIMHKGCKFYFPSKVIKWLCFIVILQINSETLFSLLTPVACCYRKRFWHVNAFNSQVTMVSPLTIFMFPFIPLWPNFYYCTNLEWSFLTSLDNFLAFLHKQSY